MLIMLIFILDMYVIFFFSGRRRLTISKRVWSSDVCSSDLAQAHANFINNGSAATWHYTVDDKHAIQHFHETTRCYHAGDGRGKGNYESIGIEMCVNSDGDYNQTLSNAASLIADIMKRRNIPLKNVVSHGYWTGKNCPRELLAAKNGVTWNDFKKMIQQGGGVVSSGSSKKP